MPTTTTTPAHAVDPARRPRALLVLCTLVACVSCSGGPPRPLHERPGERLPVWVTGRGDMAPLGGRSAGVSGPFGEGQDSRNPQTIGRGEVFPADMRAIGQALDADPARAATLAAADARRALRYHVSARIRRAMLRWLDRFRDLPAGTERELREKVWYSADNPDLLTDNQIALSEPAVDAPAEVSGAPLTLVNASVSFSVVLDAALATFSTVLGETVPAPDRRTLATLITADSSASGGSGQGR
ncbi:MAG: hypothetical protein AB7K09_23000 [Planctomycetota bacterium]